MTMRWGNISVPFASGLDTKADAKALGADKLADLRNGVFTKRGSIVKRAGQLELASDTDLTDKNSNAKAISSLRMLRAVADELVMADDANLLTWNATRQRWFDRGSIKSPVVTQRTIADLDTEQTVADCCTGGGYTLYAWEDSRGGIYCHMVEDATKAVVIADRQIDSGGSRPKCAFIDGTWHVVYADTGNTIRTYRVEATGFTGTAFQLATNLNASPLIDVEPVGDVAFVAYNDTSNDVRLLRLRQDGTTEAAATSSNSNGCSALAITWEPNTEQLALVVAENGGDKLYGAILNRDLVHVHAQNQIVDYTGNTVTNVTCKFPRDTRTGENTAVVQLDRVGNEALVRTYAAGWHLDLIRDYTIEMWIRMSATPTAGQIFHLASNYLGSGNKGYRFYLQNDAGTQRIKLGFHNGGAVNIEQVDWTPSATTWYHLAVTRDMVSGDVKFYVDGVQQGTTQSGPTGVNDSSDQDFQIGRVMDPGASHHFDGQIDEVRVWDDVRDVGEISNFRSEQIPRQANLVGYWRLNDTYLDSSGNGYTLTPVGAVNFPAGVAPPFTTFTADPDTDGWWAEVFYEFQGGDVWNNLVNRVRYSVNNEATSAAVFMRHAGIGGRAYLDDNDVIVPLLHDDAGIQRTMLHVTDDQTIVAKVLYGTHGGLITNGILPNVQALGNRRHRMVTTFRKRLATTPRTIGSDGEAAATPPQENESYSGRGIRELTLDYGHAQSHALVQVDRTAYIGGGFVWQYDGISAVESGFHLFPANVTAATANNAKEIPDNGAYFYRIYYEWTNARGERERSTFGAEVRADLGAGEDEVTLTIPTLSFTGKRGTRRDVSIVVYRTEKDPTADSPFYRVSSPDPTAAGDNRFVANDPTIDTVEFVDGYRNLATDAGAGPVLIEQELDYKNAAELDNIPPEACHIFTEGKGRIFMAGFQNGSQVRYSKQHFAGSPVEFNDALEFTVPEDGGDITGLAILNEALVVFKRRRIYVVTGNGPNNLGGGQAFGRPQLVTTDAGCINGQTIVQMPMGLMFQSSKGFYLLTQQLQVQYIGADVEAYNGQTFSSAVLLAAENRVVFLATSGRSLNFNYLFGQWSTFTNYTGVAATIWSNSLMLGRPEGRVRQESSTVYTDAGASYSLVIETAWLKLQGLQGYQRTRKASLLGEFKSSHKLRMEVAFDYEPVWRSITMDPAASGVATTYFGDPTGAFGDGGPFGSGTAPPDMESSVYQFRAHLPRQKCQAIKFKFTDRPSAAGDQPAQSYELTELMLEVGRKRGTFKPSDGKTVG